MATTAQVIEMTATRLGILGYGETLPSRINTDLNQAYTEVHAQLDIKSMATWDIDEDIPEEYVTHVVTLMAAARADDYGIPNDRYQRLMMAESKALGEILELQTSNTYKTPQADYF